MNNIGTLQLWAYEMKINSSVKCNWMAGYNEHNCPHNFYWNVWVILIYDFGVAFYCAASAGLQKNDEYSTTYSTLECSVEASSSYHQVLSSREQCSNSNPFCVAFCCNLNFINITGSILAHSYWALQDQKQMKMLSKLSPPFFFFNFVPSIVLMLSFWWIQK